MLSALELRYDALEEVLVERKLQTNVKVMRIFLQEKRLCPWVKGGRFCGSHCHQSQDARGCCWRTGKLAISSTG